MNKYLSFLGYQGPNILPMLIWVMFAAQKMTDVYPYAAVLVWQVLNHLLNITIKNWLKAPRPDSIKAPRPDSIKAPRPDSLNTEEEVTLSNFLTIHRQFGMPSGHAQAVVSELTFIALYFQKPWLTGVAALQTALTLWQRYATRRHSLTQLAVGSALGLLVGLGFYVFLLKYYKKV